MNLTCGRGSSTGAVAGVPDDFVYGLDPNFIVYYSQAKPSIITAEGFLNYPHVAAVEDLIWNYSYNKQDAMYLQFFGKQVEAVRATQTWTVGESADAKQAMA